ncbi:unnamed protein product [Polarella glacialis]|uniref:Ferredoxin n=2 Tax=Polarella glacialis TaxID=89957 RepID=A0A813I0D2_POLGL|nr:unnamed protein product [Polarella glacialis]
MGDFTMTVAQPLAFLSLPGSGPSTQLLRVRQGPPRRSFESEALGCGDGRPVALALGLGAALALACRAQLRSTRSAGRGISVLARAAAPVVDSADVVKEALKAKEEEYRRRQAQTKTQGSQGQGGDIPKLAELPRTAFVGGDGLLQVPEAEAGVRACVYAIFGPRDLGLQHVGVSRNSQTSLRAHFSRRPELSAEFAVFDVRKPDRSLLEAARQAWLSECGTPAGNAGGEEQAFWEAGINVKELMSADEKQAMDRMTAAAADAALREAVLRVEIQQVQKFEDMGCQEQLLFDTKLKAKGILDFDAAAPVGLRRPAGGVGAAFKVSLKMPNGEVVEIDCAPDITILDAAEAAGVELPSSCKSGACSTCAAKVLEGIVDQSEQSYLDATQEAAGYCMTCVCYPRSDLTFETHRQSDIL